MVIFSEFYDETLEFLSEGACPAIVPLEDGLYRAVFMPRGQEAYESVLDDPLGFVMEIVERTWEFADDARRS